MRGSGKEDVYKRQITQSLPVHGKASIMLTLDMIKMQEPVERMIESLQQLDGVEKVRLLAVD